MLKLLLEAATWDAAAGCGGPGASARLTSRSPLPSRSPSPTRRPPVTARWARSSTSRCPGARVLRPSTSPCSGMLAGRPEGEPEEPRRRTGWRRLVAGLAVALAVLAPAGMVAALTGSGNDDPGRWRPPTVAGGTKTFKPDQPEALADPFPADASVANRYPIARVRRTVKLLDVPRREVQGEDRPEDGVPLEPRALGRQAPRRMARGAGAGARQRRGRLDPPGPGVGVRHRVVGRSMSTSPSASWWCGRTARRCARCESASAAPTIPTPKGRFAVTDKLKVTQAGLPLRLLRPRPQRPSDQAPARLARRRPPRGARHREPGRPRQAGQPGVHAHRSARHEVDAQAHSSRHAGLHPGLSGISQRSAGWR